MDRCAAKRIVPLLPSFASVKEISLRVLCVFVVKNSGLFAFIRGS